MLVAACLAARVAAEAELTAALQEWRRTHPKHPDGAIADTARRDADDRLRAAFRRNRAARACAADAGERMG